MKKLELWPVLSILLALVSLTVMVTGSSAHSASVVVPNGLANADGLTNNVFPFNVASSMRYQQVFAASNFGALSGPHDITQIAFRPDGIFGGTFSSTIANIQINLSTTSAAPGGLSSTFVNNVGGDDTVVFSAALPLSSANTGPSGRPKTFDIVINLTTPFLYNPSAGNLLLDVIDIPTRNQSVL